MNRTVAVMWCWILFPELLLPHILFVKLSVCLNGNRTPHDCGTFADIAR